MFFPSLDCFHIQLSNIVDNIYSKCIWASYIDFLNIILDELFLILKT